MARIMMTCSVWVVLVQVVDSVCGLRLCLGLGLGLRIFLGLWLWLKLEFGLVFG
jgi:hypothetical protein